MAYDVQTHLRMTSRTSACILIAAAVVTAGSAIGCQSPSDSNGSIPIPEPSVTGWSSEKLNEVASYAELIGSAAVVVVHDGQVVFSWGDIEQKYQCHSIRKPFLGALYGIYVERGMLDLDATMADLEIDDIPPQLTPQEKQASVRHLLQARSGVYHEAAAEAESMMESRPERGSHAPGTFYYYNNWDFNALGTIFRQETGLNIFEAFEEQIAGPIGMEDFSLSDCAYHYEPDKSEHPAYMFRMSSRDMARFGLLYQNLGEWEGEQIVPSEWIRESTTSYTNENPERDGYGYLWKIPTPNTGFDGAFYHTGLAVHLLLVWPEEKLVVVHRVDTDNEFTTTTEELQTLVGVISAARDG